MSEKTVNSRHLRDQVRYNARFCQVRKLSALHTPVSNFRGLPFRNFWRNRNSAPGFALEKGNSPSLRAIVRLVRSMARSKQTQEAVLAAKERKSPAVTVNSLLRNTSWTFSRFRLVACCCGVLPSQSAGQDPPLRPDNGQRLNRCLRALYVTTGTQGHRMTDVELPRRFPYPRRL